MSCPICKSNDIRELENNTETIDNFENGKYHIRYYFLFLYGL